MVSVVVSSSYKASNYFDPRPLLSGYTTVTIYDAGEDSYIVGPAQCVKTAAAKVLEEFSIYGWQPTRKNLIKTAADTLRRHGFRVNELTII